MHFGYIPNFLISRKNIYKKRTSVPFSPKSNSFVPQYSKDAAHHSALILLTFKYPTEAIDCFITRNGISAWDTVTLLHGPNGVDYKLRHLNQKKKYS